MLRTVPVTPKRQEDYRPAVGDAVIAELHALARLRRDPRVLWLLPNPQAAAEMGAAGHEHLRQHFLITRYLRDYRRVFQSLGAGVPYRPPLRQVGRVGSALAGWRPWKPA